MSPIVIRFVFAALLLAAVAGRIQAFHAPRIETPDKIAEVLKLHGLTAANEPTAPGTNTKVVSAAVPGCKEPLRVAVIGLSLEEAPLLEAILPPTYARRYVYLGQAWRTAAPVSIRMQWLKHKFGSILGFSRAGMLGTVLFVAAPHDCPAIDTIDWRRVWSL